AGFDDLGLGFGRARAGNEEGFIVGLAVEKTVEHGGLMVEVVFVENPGANARRARRARFRGFGGRWAPRSLARFWPAAPWRQSRRQRGQKCAARRAAPSPTP
nr:hypothetical protein [Tanacetum cinerariifolium]